MGQPLPPSRLEEKARIFTKGSKGILTKYQLAIHNASVELCRNNPSLLFERNKLFDEARKKVREDGYDFVKGTSRAKSSDNIQVTPKQAKTTRDDTAEYIKKLENDISSKKNKLGTNSTESTKLQTLKTGSYVTRLAEK